MSDTKIWVVSKTLGWEVANVIEIKDDEYTVQTIDGVVAKFPKSKVHSTDDSHFVDTNDLCTMNRLHEAPLLDVLRRRFKNNSIYTTTSDVLISINPYKTIPGLYDCKSAYLINSSVDNQDPSLASKPHVYKIANYAFEMLKGSESGFSSSRNQSIVVTGESGAGKTEASKHVMNFLIGADQGTSNTENSELIKQIGEKVGKVLLESNVIFEAFGNAKTVRNDNSSRFGKYIKLQYSTDKRIISAFTETFLLEKSRLVNISANERNYHIFYQFLRGNSNQELTEKLRLTSPDKFKMLCDANGIANKSSEDANFEELLAALSTLGLSDEEISYLWTVLACILHLGNISCTPPDEDNGKVKIESPSMPIGELTTLLGISELFFGRNLTTQRVKVSSRSSVSMKVLTATEVSNNILALLKWMYSCLFSWLVKKINYKHCSVSSELPNAKVVNFIGILDIFGFEILQTNSFEQLCINFTNERLQQQFNEYIFDREQEIYRSEGLDWTTINYKDNQDVIDLIGKKPTGILTMLEEQGMLNRGGADESALLNSIIHTHEHTSTFAKSRFTNDGKFIIKHFAGEVTYCIFGFLEKNNDSLQDDLIELMLGSTNPFIQNAIVSVGMERPFTPNAPGFIGDISPDMMIVSTGHQTISVDASTPISTAVEPKKAGRRLGTDGGGKKLATTVTVSFQFRAQLDSLLVSLRTTSLHYIKCIKPNGLKVPEVFDSHMVLEQLRYSGALEVVRIRQEGFPIALPFVSFYTTFEILSFNKGWQAPSECSVEQAKEYAKTLSMEWLTNLDFQIGTSKIFLRTSAYEDMLKAIKTFLGRKVSKMQALKRGIDTRKWYAIVRRRFIYVQAMWRMQSRKKAYKIKLAEIIAARTREQERLAEIERQKQLVLAAKLKEEKRLAEIERLKVVAKIEAERLAKLAAEEAKRKADEEKRILNLRVSKLQAIIRRNAQKKLFAASIQKIILIQSLARVCLSRKWFNIALAKKKELEKNKMNKRISLLQAVFRKIAPRKQFLQVKRCAIIIQSGIRMHLKRNWFKKTMEEIREQRRLAKIAADEAERKAKLAAEDANRIAEIERLKEAQRAAKAAAEEQVKQERAARAEAARLAREAQEEAERREFEAQQELERLAQEEKELEEQMAAQYAAEIEQQKLAVMERKVIKIQSIVRRKSAVERYNKVIYGIMKLQAVARMKPWRSWYHSTLEYNREVVRVRQESLLIGVIKLQSIARRNNDLVRYRTMLLGIVRLQSVARMKQQRSYYLEDIEIERERLAEEQLQAKLVAEETARVAEEARLAEIARVEELARIEAEQLDQLERERIAAEEAEAARLALLAAQEAERLLKEEAMEAERLRVEAELEAQRLAQLAAEEAARIAHELKVQKVVRIQSIARRNSARERYNVAIQGIIFFQSYVRMRPWRIWFNNTQAYNAEVMRLAEEDLHFKVSKLQSFVRKRSEVRKYRLTRVRIICLQARMRMKLKQWWYQRVIIAKINAEKQAAQAYEDRIQGLHCACRAANISLVKILLQANPNDYNILDIKHKDCTVLHSACWSGSVDLVAYLNPRMEEYSSTDKDGNLPIHYIAMSPSVPNKSKINLFKHILSVFEPQPTASAKLSTSVRPELTTTKSLHRIESIKMLSREVESISSKLDSSVNQLVDASNNRILKCGWLKKKGETAAWQKRWVVLTSDSLTYYITDKDKIARDSISFSAKNSITVNRLESDMSTGIDIVMRHGQTTTIKKRNRVSLFAESEQEIQGWINILKACAGVESHFTSQVSKVRYATPAIRQALLNQYNTSGDSILHLLSACENGDAVENLETVAWLICNGANVNTINRQSRNPVQCAKLAGNNKLSALLSIRGVKRSGCFDDPPPRLRNFHYISFLLHKQTIFDATKDIAASEIIVSIYNNNNLLAEAPQTTQSVDVTSNCILWLDICHIQIPFENLGNDAYAIFEVKSKGSNEVQSWMHFKLTKDNLDTKNISLSVLPPPVVLSFMGPNASAIKSTLEMEVLVTRRTGNESIMSIL